MGVRKLSSAAFGVIAELSASYDVNNGAFYISSGSTTYTVASKGTVAATQSASGFTAPNTAVIAGAFDIVGDITTIRANATPTTNNGDQGTGNYGNYALFFGRRGGASNPFNGLDFGGICVNKTLTASQLSSAERWTSSRTGVVL
jgi:hypothetical protein